MLANKGALTAVDGGLRRWGYHQEQPDAAVAAAVATLAREGKPLAPLDLAGGLRAWFRTGATWMHTYAGSVLFCSNGVLCCCLANKVPGLRAAVVTGAMQTSRA